MVFTELVTVWLWEPFTWLTFVVAFLTVYVFNFVTKVRQLPPGPRALPFIGNILQLRAPKPLYAKAVEWSKQYGDPFTIWIASRPVVIAGSKDSFKDVSGPLRNVLGGRLQSNVGDMQCRGNADVVFSDFGPAWDVLRRLVHVAIRQYAKTDKLAELVAEHVDFELEEIFKGKKKVTTEIVEYIEEVLNNVLGKSTFGEGFQKGETDYEEFRAATKYFEDEAANGLPSDIHPVLGWIFYKKERKIAEALNSFFRITDKNFNQAKDTWTPGSSRHFTDALLNSREKFLEEDRASAKYLTDNNLAQSIFDIFGAGSTTSRSILGFCCLYLATYPDIQEELRNEILTEIGTNVCKNADRDKVPKVDAFLQEVLRLHPAAPLSLPRRALSDATINGRHIPKNTGVFINLYSVNRDPSIWGPDSNEFKPSRFLSLTKNQQANGMNSFGIGARACPGEKMAQADMLYVLVRTLQKVRLSCPEGTTILDLSAIDSDVTSDPKRQQITLTLI